MSEERTKVCADCGQEKPISMFKTAPGRYYIPKYCRECKAIRKEQAHKQCWACGKQRPLSEYSLYNGKMRRKCNICIAKTEEKKKEIMLEKQIEQDFLADVLRRRRPKSTLTKEQREARMTERLRKAEELGMDYGSYVAMLHREGKA